LLPLDFAEAPASEHEKAGVQPVHGLADGLLGVALHDGRRGVHLQKRPVFFLFTSLEFASTSCQKTTNSTLACFSSQILSARATILRELSSCAFLVDSNAAVGTYAMAYSAQQAHKIEESATPACSVRQAINKGLGKPLPIPWPATG
jgi:hypothetical protein